MTKDPAVSIVIRSYNEEQHIGRLLTGIMQQSLGQDIEIVIVDSGSTDATLSIALRFPVKIVAIPPDEFSFGRALNRGCTAASGRVIVIASAHVYPVYSDWLHHLMKPFTDERVALVYGKQRGNNATLYSEHQIFSAWFGENSVSNQGHPFCNNANAAIRRSLWEKYPYDENLTGLEDLDWATRMMKLGYQICYSAEAEVHHIHNETWGRIYQRYRREAMALKVINPSEHFGFVDFCTLLGRNVLSDCHHSLQERVLAANLKKIFLFRLMQFWGTYRGFRQVGAVTRDMKQKFYYPPVKGRHVRSPVGDARNAARVDYSAHGGEDR